MNVFNYRVFSSVEWLFSTVCIHVFILLSQLQDAGNHLSLALQALSSFPTSSTNNKSDFHSAEEVVHVSSLSLGWDTGSYFVRY